MFICVAAFACLFCFVLMHDYLMVTCLDLVGCFGLLFTLGCITLMFAAILLGCLGWGACFVVCVVCIVR